MIPEIVNVICRLSCHIAGKALKRNTQSFFILPAQVEDIKNAMECVIRKISEFDLPFDMNEAYLMGHSSGGHLAMMAVLYNASGMIKIPNVKGVILESASSDILICSNASLPPVLMFHCINDPVISVENSRTLYRKLDEKNHSVEYYEIKDWEEHGGNIYFSETVLSIIQDFIKKTK